MSRRGIVLISDIHFSLNTLPEATSALTLAMKTAKQLDYELIIAGDLIDTKAIVRGEVLNRLVSLFDEYLDHHEDRPYILVGNHDKINEKGEEHTLNFLRPYANVVQEAHPIGAGYFLIPYQSSVEAFKHALFRAPANMPIIMHQGVLGAFLGDYVQDKTSIDPKELGEREVYSGHYHRQQYVAPVMYIGSPYTMSFGEANDGPKGFLVINHDGVVKPVFTNLRKHTIIERDETSINVAPHGVKPHDILVLKVSGKADWLKTLDKEELGNRFIGHSNYRLDLIPYDESTTWEKTGTLAPTELLTSVIQASDASESRKEELQRLVAEILNETQ